MTQTKVNELIASAVAGIIAKESGSEERGAIAPSIVVTPDTPQLMLVALVVPLLDRIAASIKAELELANQHVPSDLPTLIHSATWPAVSDEHSLQVHALIMLERRLAAIEDAIRALHEFERRRLEGRKAGVERISSTSQRVRYVPKKAAVQPSDLNPFERRNP